MCVCVCVCVLCGVCVRLSLSVCVLVCCIVVQCALLLTLLPQGRSNLPPDKIPWSAFCTLLSQCIYGGRIDNEFDQVSSCVWCVCALDLVAALVILFLSVS